jgi:ABC-2 type transport system permease protein
VIARRAPVFWRTFREIRWHIVGYGLGLALYGALIVAIFPAYADMWADIELPAAYESLFGEAVTDLARPSNFLSVEFFAWVPIVLSIYAAVVSTGMLAGEESRGTTELLLALPVTRSRVFAEKVAGFVLGALVITLLASLGWVAAVPFVDLSGDVSIPELTLATVGLLSAPMFFASVGLLLGALAPSRAAAAGILSALIVFTFLASSFAALISETEWLRYVSPFYYSDSTELLTSGVTPWHLAMLVGGTIVCGGFALIAFRGRDIGVGYWQLRAAVARA